MIPIFLVSIVLDDLPRGIKSVSFWSQGSSSQLKNRYIADGPPAFEMKHGIHIIGIDGSIKRQAWAEVKTRKAIMSYTATFAAAANGVESKIELLRCKSWKLLTEIHLSS